MTTKKKKVYLRCSHIEGNAYCGPNDIGIEHMGTAIGEIVSDDGTVLGTHFSSSIGWLRKDLLSKLDNPEMYEIIDELPEY